MAKGRPPAGRPGPRGSFVVPLEYDWHLLVGDESALPAIARRLEELPPGKPVIALIEAAAEAAVARAVRQALVDTHGLDKSRIRAASYWKRGEAAVHETHD